MPLVPGGRAVLVIPGRPLPTQRPTSRYWRRYGPPVEALRRLGSTTMSGPGYETLVTVGPAHVVGRLAMVATHLENLGVLRRLTNTVARDLEMIAGLDLHQYLHIPWFLNPRSKPGRFIGDKDPVVRGPVTDEVECCSRGQSSSSSDQSSHSGSSVRSGDSTTRSSVSASSST